MKIAESLPGDKKVRSLETITKAFRVCDNCDRTYPSGYNICQHCNGALRIVEVPVQPSGEQPVLPIELLWTHEHLIDKLTVHLAAVEEIHGDNVRMRKYLAQAQHLMYRIPVHRPTPAFVVNLSDLTEQIVRDLEACNRRGLEHVVKSAVGRIFEAINFEYYTLSVARSLVVKIEQ